MVWIALLLMGSLWGCELQAEKVPVPVAAPPPSPARIAALAATPVPRPSGRQAFARAAELIDRNEHERARPLLEPLAAGDEVLADYVLHWLAIGHTEAGRPHLARGLWERLLAEYPQSVHVPRAALGLGRLLRAAAAYEKARRRLEVAGTAEDDAIVQWARVEQAEIDVTTGRPAAAHARLMDVRRAAAGSPVGDRARQRVVELRHRFPALAPTGSDLEAEADLLLAEGQAADALAIARTLTRTASGHRRSVLLHLRARAERAAGETETALGTLRAIADHHPDSAEAPEALFLVAKILWNRDDNTEAGRVFAEYLRRYPRHRHRVEARYALGRIAQSAGDDTEAIAHYLRVLRSYPGTRLARDSHWRIGWINYENGDWKEAIRVLKQMVPRRGTAQAADAIYWYGRALERAGQTAEARAQYERIVRHAPESYYAYWAEQRLGRRPGSPRIVAPARATSIDDPEIPGLDDFHLRRARELHRIGIDRLALDELRALERSAANDRRLRAFLIRTYPLVGGYRHVIRLGSRAHPQETHPLAFWSLVEKTTRRHGVDPLMVVSLMRQESLFDPRALSPADARGLMQLLPSTAQREAQRLGVRFRSQDLYDPAYNIRLGVAHLAHLLGQYGEDWLRVLAAYNAGSSAVAKWDRRFAHLAPDEWVENITYRETRDYVKKVLGNYRKYGQIYGVEGASREAGS